MGLFDELAFEEDNPLLPNDWPLEGWQTKDLDCGMDRYVILKNGRVIRKARKIERSKSASKPHTFYFSDRLTETVNAYHDNYEFSMRIVDGFVMDLVPGNAKKKFRGCGYLQLAAV